MKRITKLEISNFRAFVDSYLIELNKGENLFIYGENGSGKSSLFKSVSNFLSSSQNTAFPYTRNHSKDTEVGNLTFTFNDYDLDTNAITSAFGEVINFGTDLVTTNTVQFIKTADLTKGFLDYRDILAVYNHKSSNPNLFDLLVKGLLNNFIPIGKTKPLGQLYKLIFLEIVNSISVRSKKLKIAVEEMNTFESDLKIELDKIYFQLNLFLIKYFRQNLRVWYEFNTIIDPNYPRAIPNEELFLKVKINGTIVDHPSDFLNEAKLSSIAICLHLAILKCSPQTIDYKILFLDDVFIGLDLTNRLPILDIIKNEFSDYQVFISTYDRHLYELAKRKFENEAPGRWKSVELFVGKDLVNNQPVDRPILVIGHTHLEKATQYLHDRVKPDYPASANYFRKALEELIQEYIPKWETADSENTQIPDYQLTSLAFRTKHFLEKTGNDSQEIIKIIGLLPSLLHPLSHHEISSPIYKGELLGIETSYTKLRQQLSDMDITNNYRCCLEGSKRLKITFVIDESTNHFSFYELILKGPLTMKRNGAATPIILKVHCVADRCYGYNGVNAYPTFNPDKRSPDFNYESLSNAYDRIHAYIIGSAIGAFPKAPDYLTTIQYHDGTNWLPISNLIVWV